MNSITFLNKLVDLTREGQGLPVGDLEMIQGLAVKTWNHHVSLQQDINSLQQTLTDLRLRVNELKTEAMARENDVLCGQIEAQEKQIRDLDEFLASLGHVEIRKV